MNTLIGFVEQVLKVYPILQQAAVNGLDIDIEQHGRLVAQFEQDLQQVREKLTKDIPEELKKYRPQRKNKQTGVVEVGYKTLNKKLKAEIGQLYAEYQASLSDLDWPKWLEIHPVSDIRVVGQTATEYIYGRRLPVKTSWLALRNYILLKQKLLAREGNPLALKYKIPEVYKKGVAKETTSGKLLLKLAKQTGDRWLQLVVQERSLAKMLSNDLPNWKPGADGKVHTTWGFNPPQGQLNSRNPNIQNASKHTELGNLFRAIIAAPTGYRYVELDMNSFHVATMAWLAQCMDYYRFSQLDPHSIFTTWIIPDSPIPQVRFEMTNAEIRAITKLVKSNEQFAKIRQHTAKPAVLGNQLGLGPKKLFHDNAEYIKSYEIAVQLQKTLEVRFGAVDRAKAKLIELAHLEKHLINPFGRIQWFQEVYKYKYDERAAAWVKTFSPEKDQVLAFGVQSLAFDMMYSYLKIMKERGIIDRYRFVNTIHDSVMFRPHVKDVEKCFEEVSQVLTIGLPQLKTATFPEGLKVGVEYSSGRNLGKKTKENPEGMEEIGKVAVL